MMLEEFRMDNTEGYTQEELDSFNAEWADYCEKHGLDEDSQNYEQEAKWFSDEIARR
tara:strand:+ start:1218 stop:1388 length:171 start_codon:yes stop_codon:yes gene_type:complete